MEKQFCRVYKKLSEMARSLLFLHHCASIVVNFYKEALVKVKVELELAKTQKIRM